MGTDMFIQAMTYTGESTPYGEIKTLEPILVWRNYDIMEWFDAHIDTDSTLDMGPYYEFDTAMMDEFIKDCEDAANEKGWFFEYITPDEPETLKTECKTIADELKMFRQARKKHWNTNKLYFLYCQG